MNEEPVANPYDPPVARDKDVAPEPPSDHQPNRGTPPTARWLAVPFFILGGSAMFVAVTLLVTGFLLPQGEFVGLLSTLFGAVAALVGAVVGLTVGIGFARGTHFD